MHQTKGRWLMSAPKQSMRAARGIMFWVPMALTLLAVVFRWPWWALLMIVVIFVIGQLMGLPDQPQESAGTIRPLWNDPTQTASKRGRDRMVFEILLFGSLFLAYLFVMARH